MRSHHLGNHGQCSLSLPKGRPSKVASGIVQRCHGLNRTRPGQHLQVTCRQAQLTTEYVDVVLANLGRRLSQLPRRLGQLVWCARINQGAPVLGVLARIPHWLKQVMR